jgi:glycosyltransferase involved in cell wall biosynthesis
MADIRILIAGHLCNAPRARKEAQALSEAGHRVTVQGVCGDETLAKRDASLVARAAFTLETVADLRGAVGLGHRVRHRLGRELWRCLRWARPAALGYAVGCHLRAARRARPDLTIAHSEGALWVVQRLAAGGLRVGVDFEDWFSEDLPFPDRWGRPVPALQRLERFALQKARYRLAASRAMALELGRFAGVEPPVPIYNAFAWSDRSAPAPPAVDKRHPKRPSIHWFSQTIGPARGLETLFAALPHLRHDAEVHLRGQLATPQAAWLHAQVPEAWRQRVFVHPTVHPSELLARIGSHDIGLSLESPTIRSRDLTVTNKLLHYLLAGLAVVATATRGQREIAELAGGAVALVPPADPPALAAALDRWLAFPDHLRTARRVALKATESTLSWERQRERLLDEAALALATDPVSNGP